MIKSLLFFFLFSSLLLSGQGNIYKTIVPVKCDSLIKANESNPDFVILDVRTPAEYNPQHLKGAINRNYYDSDFSAQLDSLDHNKIYLIYCRSGSRSGKTFQQMQNKEFVEVYNMQGGITAWKYASLPVVSDFHPKIMLVSDSIYDQKNIPIGHVDTISITVTNRANDTLKYLYSTELSGSKFYTDFDITKTQLGAEDYKFNIFYQPEDEVTDSLIFVLESNGGTQNIYIIRSGKNTTKLNEKFTDNIKIYPNPVDDILKIEYPSNTEFKIIVSDISGKIVYKSTSKYPNKYIDISGIKKGIYFIKIFNSQLSISKKINIFH